MTAFIRFRSISFDFIRFCSILFDFVQFRSISFDFVLFRFATGGNVLLLVIQFVEIGNVISDNTFIFANC